MQVHDGRRLGRAGAAERQQRKGARIDAALDRHLADAVRLAPIGDLDDAVGERFDAHGGRIRTRQLCGERREAGTRARHIERDAAADQRRRNAAEHQIGIRDGRLAAAVRVAHRAGLGAGAPRPDLEIALAADPGDRAAAGADGLDIDHRDADRKRTDRAAVGEMRLAAFDQAEIRRGAAGVERNHIVETRDPGDDGAADGAGRRARQRGGDRLAHHLIGAGDAARRLHHQERPLAQPGAERLVDTAQIALHVRLDEHVDQRRHGALVLAVFGQHLARQRHRAARIFLRDDLGDAALMRRVGIGMHEADPDRGDVVVAKIARRGAHARLVERSQLVAAKIETAAGLAHEPQRHDAGGLHPEIRIAVALGHRLAGDFQDVAKALGHDQAEPVDATLQQRVGGDRGAVGEPRHIGDASAHVVEDLVHATHKPDRRIGRRARDLGDAHRAGPGIDRDDVGKGAAGVDADAKARRAVRLKSCRLTAPCRVGVNSCEKEATAVNGYNCELRPAKCRDC